MDARGGAERPAVITWLRGEGEPQLEHLIEEKEACVMETSPIPSFHNYCVRKAWFINSVDQQVAYVPEGHRAPAVVNLDRPTVYFKGWPSLSKNWIAWVDKLEPMCGQIWRRLGIYDAVQATTYKLNKHALHLLGAACFWCGLTNTFIFPWGEATITLEDVMMLGGLPVAGKPLNQVMRQERVPIARQNDPLERQILIERKKVCRESSIKKAEFGAWTKHFVDLDGDVEHAAFLALWLSRFVFPVESPVNTVRMETIPVAILMVRGTRVALGQSVLASLYRDLRTLKSHVHQAMDSSNNPPSLVLWAPFHLLQLWLWERFKALRPLNQDIVRAGMPRLAKWCNHGSYVKPEALMSILIRPTEFLWRPYASDSSNTPPRTFYSDVGRWFRTPRTVDGNGEFEPVVELISFGTCLKDTSLTGTDCVEAYNPHRVSMQFGYDQDIPGYTKREPPPRNLPPDAMEGVELYLAPRMYRPMVTMRYASWWTQCMLPCIPDQIVYDFSLTGERGSGRGRHRRISLNRAESSSNPRPAGVHFRSSDGASTSRTPPT